MSIYEAYGEVSRKIDDNTLVAWRASIQKSTEPLILRDIIDKLELKAEDCVLDIGCGLGTLLLPLSFVVKKIYGIDHPDIITRLEKMPQNNNCCLFAGNWLKDDFVLPDVSKIVIYSVIHYMASVEEAIGFIEKALSCLPAGGRLLLGDIPNDDKKERFSKTDFGVNFNKEWQQQRALYKNSEEEKRDQLVKEHQLNNLIHISDETIFLLMGHIRRLGHEAYLLPQKPFLPFGNTREDILIIKA
jgi:SAM-dependent methyltransferase